MAFHVRNPRTEARVRELARKKGLGVTEAIDYAVSDVLRREAEVIEERRRRTRALLDEYAKLPRTGFVPDKAFYDELSGE